MRALFGQHKLVKKICGRTTAEKILQLGSASLTHALKI
jgi:hypothetical protein